MDQLREECGVFGVYNQSEMDSAHMGYFALQALQHRGQDGCGMAASNGGPAQLIKNIGLVTDVFQHDGLGPLMGKKLLIGHVRYATSGATNVLNTQPLLMKFQGGFLALAHNGHLVNAPALSRYLREDGVLFQTDMDTELIAHLISRSRAKSMPDRIKEMMECVYGSYALVLMTRTHVYGVRDPWGIRPLCIGKLGDTYMVASESCAFDVLGAEFVRDVEPGEIISIGKEGIQSYRTPVRENHGTCLFEYVYFARPDSVIDGIPVYQARRRAGQMLASVQQVDADIVAGVPDTAIAAAQGYAEASGIPYGDVLVKNRYIGRTFITPKQQARELAVRLKLSVLKKQVAGKRVLLVDDSIVRGTNSIIIARMLRDAGAKEVHMRISSPPVKFPCLFGINTPTSKHLIGAQQSVEDLRKSLGLDSLAYLDLPLLEQAVSDYNQGYCTACFDGNYPMDIHKCKNCVSILKKIKKERQR